MLFLVCVAEPTSPLRAFYFIPPVFIIGPHVLSLLSGSII